jgi:choline dehydrogenase
MPKDPRSGSALGGFNQLTTVDPKTLRRSYSARDYYQPNAGRSNLSLLSEALVSKINFEKNSSNNLKATGVSIIKDGATHTIKVNKEVVVCGGTINSPQILELSGIGSPNVLSKTGIEVLVDNPHVGENLNDHTASGLAVVSCLLRSHLILLTNSQQVKDEYPTSETLVRNPELLQQAMQAYIKHKAGPFTNAPTTTGFASLQMIDPNLMEPEQHIRSLVTKHQELHPGSDPAGREQLLAQQMLDPKEAVAQMVLLPTGADLRYTDKPAQVFLHDAPGNWCTLGICSTHSLSRGSVHIQSSDPTKHPIIDPAYFSHPLDLDICARGLLHAINLMKYEPLRSKLKLTENGDVIVHPGSGPLPKTLEEAKETAAMNTVTEYHPIGTCAMLPREKGGVVDNQLRVYGTSNVRVVDASIFPVHVQGNIVSLVYAVAEKAADLIKGKAVSGVGGQ